jgi:dsDNA-specific endonuclease/ATPase MutS2
MGIGFPEEEGDVSGTQAEGQPEGGLEEAASEEDRPIRIPLEDSLDLHPFPPQEIPDLVEEYLEACQGAGYAEVRIIHGRGIGAQRRIVQSLLQKSTLVRSFHDAPSDRGGWGATIVYLWPAVHSDDHYLESEEQR